MAFRWIFWEISDWGKVGERFPWGCMLVKNRCFFIVFCGMLWSHPFDLKLFYVLHDCIRYTLSICSKVKKMRTNSTYHQWGVRSTVAVGCGLNMIEPDAVLFRILVTNTTTKWSPPVLGVILYISISITLYSRSYPHIAGHLWIGSICNDRRVTHLVWSLFLFEIAAFCFLNARSLAAVVRPLTDQGYLVSRVLLLRYIIGIYIYMGVSKKRGTPKWMVKMMENPIKSWWFGEKTHYFWKPPYIYIWNWIELLWHV